MDELHCACRVSVPDKNLCVATQLFTRIALALPRRDLPWQVTTLCQPLVGEPVPGDREAIHRYLVAEVAVLRFGF